MALEPVESMRVPKKSSSPVWKYFQQHINKDGSINYKKAYCLLCKSNISYCGTTTNLSNHLHARHREEFLKINNITNKDTNQTNMNQFNRVLGVKKKSEIDESVALMISLDMQPLSIVENKGFRKLIQTILPGKFTYTFSCI